MNYKSTLEECIGKVIKVKLEDNTIKEIFFTEEDNFYIVGHELEEIVRNAVIVRDVKKRNREKAEINEKEAKEANENIVLNIKKVCIPKNKIKEISYKTKLFYSSYNNSLVLKYMEDNAGYLINMAKKVKPKTKNVANEVIKKDVEGKSSGVASTKEVGHASEINKSEKSINVIKRFN